MLLEENAPYVALMTPICLPSTMLMGTGEETPFREEISELFTGTYLKILNMLEDIFRCYVGTIIP
jgi:hypothetical protein